MSATVVITIVLVTILQSSDYSCITAKIEVEVGKKD